jgi:hypothetical protein
VTASLQLAVAARLDCTFEWLAFAVATVAHGVARLCNFASEKIFVRRR